MCLIARVFIDSEWEISVVNNSVYYTRLARTYSKLSSSFSMHMRSRMVQLVILLMSLWMISSRHNYDNFFVHDVCPLLAITRLVISSRTNCTSVRDQSVSRFIESKMLKNTCTKSSSEKTDRESSWKYVENRRSLDRNLLRSTLISDNTAQLHHHTLTTHHNHNHHPSVLSSFFPVRSAAFSLISKKITDSHSTLNSLQDSMMIDGEAKLRKSNEW